MVQQYLQRTGTTGEQVALGDFKVPGDDISIPHGQETQLVSHTGKSWLFGLILRLDKSGTPTNLGRDVCRLRIYRDGAQFNEYNLSRLVDLVYGSAEPADNDTLIVHKDDVDNNSFSLTLNFPASIYCPTSWAIKLNNTSADDSDDYTAKVGAKFARSGL